MDARSEDGLGVNDLFYLLLLTLCHCSHLLHAGRGRARDGLPVLARDIALEVYILLHLEVQGVY